MTTNDEQGRGLITEAEAPPPDDQRCTYDLADLRRCATRARWQVTTIGDSVTGEPREVEGAWPLLCERPRKILAAEGYIVPVGDGGVDVVAPFKGESS